MSQPSIDKVKCRICDAGMLIEHSQAHMQAHLDSGFDPEMPSGLEGCAARDDRLCGVTGCICECHGGGA